MESRREERLRRRREQARARRAIELIQGVCLSRSNVRCLTHS